MKIVRTIKLKLNLDPSQKILVQRTLESFIQALQYASKCAFDHGELTHKPTLQKLVYVDLRTRFHLKSQMAVNVCTAVSGSYATQHSNQVFGTLATYKRPKTIYSYGRDYSLLKDGKTLSLNTIENRIKVPFRVPTYFQKYLDGSWTFGSLELLKNGSLFFAHITVNKEVKEQDNEIFQNVIGIDIGQNFLATLYDSKGRIKFYKGRYLKDMRARYKHVRKQLQEKGTHRAHKKLCSLNQREHRHMTDINHCISKDIVEYAKQTNAIVVMEDLTGINLSCKVKRNNRYYRVSWAFNQLQQFIEYKALQYGLKVLYVNPKYTSQICPECGHIHRSNRNKSLHLFRCKTCGHQANDDLIGARNIHQRGRNTVYQ